MLPNVTPGGLMVVARKRRGWDQAEAARAIGVGLHDYVSIERGRLIPNALTKEGAAILESIERVLELPVSTWAAYLQEPAA